MPDAPISCPSHSLCAFLHNTVPVDVIQDLAPVTL